MWLYSRFSMNVLAFIVSIVLFGMLNFSYNNLITISNENNNSHQNFENKIQNLDQESEKKVKEKNKKKEDKKKINEIKFNWGIYIPKINLNAQISEGTTKEVMDKYVGHFADTAVVKGNVCLGAHNRGYPVNYFENIKSLEKGDLIYYKKDDLVKKYTIETVTVIKDTDWSYLENTEDNRITLITCVENEPDYRRCVQAIE